MSFARATQSQVVQIGSWAADEEHKVFPIGSKPKRMLICPDPAPEPFLIPGWAYLFKTAGKPRFSRQVWSEVIAYRLGVALGREVPPAFVAVDERSGEAGALIEFFYDVRQGEQGVRFIHGAEYLSRVLTDTKRGRPHGLLNNLRICRALGLPDPESWWGQTLAFDALIGNVDRHPDNWGVLFSEEGAKFAPIFDNGSSLGYELDDEQVLRKAKDGGLDSYIAAGTHHCAWSAREDEFRGHVSLCHRLGHKYAGVAKSVQMMLDFDDKLVPEILDTCVSLEGGGPFSPERAAFLADLIWRRRTALIRAPGSEQ